MKKRDKSTKGTGCLPFLKGPPLKTEGDVPPDWYERLSVGLKKLTAESDAKRDLMVAVLNEPERRRRQTMAWLMEDEPSPSASKH